MTLLTQVVRIEGVGNGAGQWAFTTQRVPSDPLCRAWFPAGAVPSLASYSVPPLGGVVAQGEYSFELVDVGDQLTAQLAHESTSISSLFSAVGSAATSVEFLAPPGSPGDVVCVGRECMRLESPGVGLFWNVTRGFLGTTATSHRIRSRVYRRLQYLAGRQVVVSVRTGSGPLATESELGRFWLDLPQLDETLNVWRFACRSRDRLLDRLVYPKPLTDGVRVSSEASILPRNPDRWRAHYNQRLFIRAGDTIVRVHRGGGSDALTVESVGVAGTPSADLAGIDSIEQVFIADDSDDFASFRWSPTIAGSAANPATWAPDSHPIPVILALLTSNHSAGTANGTVGLGYFACLPQGVGCGVPATEIDASSVYRTWSRSQRARIPFFAITSETKSAREAIDAIAKYCGYTVGWRGSLLTIDLRSSAAPTSTISLSDVVTRESGGARVPMLGSPRYSDAYLATRVEMKSKSERGTEVNSAFTLSDFPLIFGAQEGLYGDQYTLEVDASFVRADAVGDEPEYLRGRALDILTTFRDPLWTLQLTTGIDLLTAVSPGDVVAFRHPQLPDMRTGTRGGHLGATWWVLEARPDFGAGTVTWTLLSRGNQPAPGEIAPSARIASAVGSVVTVSANRYTDPDNAEGLPANDAMAFAVGDVVRLRDRSGVAIATTPTFTTVTALSASTITLASSLGGELTAGRIIEYVDAADANAAMLAAKVYLADELSETVGAATQAAWRFGRQT